MSKNNMQKMFEEGSENGETFLRRNGRKNEKN